MMGIKTGILQYNVGNQVVQDAFVVQNVVIRMGKFVVSELTKGLVILLGNIHVRPRRRGWRYLHTPVVDMLKRKNKHRTSVPGLTNLPSMIQMDQLSSKHRPESKASHQFLLEFLGTVRLEMIMLLGLGQFLGFGDHQWEIFDHQVYVVEAWAQSVSQLGIS
ncbi:hypothetical protein Tco_1326424 [Tanacetum coccineum]